MGASRFEVLPAIDVSGGKLARSVPGSERDPVAVATKFVAAGARWLHFVDLDALGQGNPHNLELLTAIVELGVPVQVGGGLRPRGIEQVLGRGARRAVLGASALGNPPTVHGMTERWGDRVAVGLDVAGARVAGDRVAVGLDVAGARVAPRGFEPGPLLEQALGTIAGARPSIVVVTDVERDGALAGPNVELLRRVADGSGVPVVASGGVASLEDVRAVAALWPAVVGVIVGRALHEGRFTLPDALAAVDAFKS